jgi:L-cysteine desulfidase
MDINPAPDLGHEMANDTIIISYLEDETIAKEFYAALSNMQWEKIDNKPDDELIIAKLQGIVIDAWSCSWRYAAGIVADIRNMHYNTHESYIDFYCSGNEGVVTERVEECFKRMGWKPHAWEQ